MRRLEAGMQDGCLLRANRPHQMLPGCTLSSSPQLQSPRSPNRPPGSRSRTPCVPPPSAPNASAPVNGCNQEGVQHLLTWWPVASCLGRIITSAAWVFRPSPGLPALQPLPSVLPLRPAICQRRKRRSVRWQRRRAPSGQRAGGWRPGEGSSQKAQPLRRPAQVQAVSETALHVCVRLSKALSRSASLQDCLVGASGD